MTFMVKIAISNIFGRLFSWHIHVKTNFSYKMNNLSLMIPMKKLKMTVKMIYGGNWGEKDEKRKNKLFSEDFGISLR